MVSVFFFWFCFVLKAYVVATVGLSLTLSLTLSLSLSTEAFTQDKSALRFQSVVAAAILDDGAEGKGDGGPQRQAQGQEEGHDGPRRLRLVLRHFPAHNIHFRFMSFLETLVDTVLPNGWSQATAT